MPCNLSSRWFSNILNECLHSNNKYSVCSCCLVFVGSQRFLGFFAWSITWFFISSVFWFHHQYLKDSWAEMAFPVWPVWCIHQSPGSPRWNSRRPQRQGRSGCVLLSAAGTETRQPRLCSLQRSWRHSSIFPHRSWDGLLSRRQAELLIRKTKPAERSL